MALRIFVLSLKDFISEGLAGGSGVSGFCLHGSSVATVLDDVDAGVSVLDTASDGVEAETGEGGDIPSDINWHKGTEGESFIRSSVESHLETIGHATLALITSLHANLEVGEWIAGEFDQRRVGTFEVHSDSEGGRDDGFASSDSHLFVDGAGARAA